MRHHENCADWGYDTHPDRQGLRQRCSRLTNAISQRCSTFDRFKFDTRPGHAFLFGGMAPGQCSCIVGEYRGTASCAPLANCRVTAGADRMVGLDPLLVATHMRLLEEQCAALLHVHQHWLATKGSTQSPRNALLRFVTLLAIVLEKFLTIHPYMDGNGHSARLLIYTIMARGGYAPRNWDIDAKQPYGEALSQHRRGKPGALQAFLLQAI